VEKLFEDFLAHLRLRHGLALAKHGVMIDASFADVPRQRNSREENAEIKEGKVPESLSQNPKVLAHKDMDARWTKKNNETHYGYKDHVKVDVRDKLILAAVVTPASTHDSQALDKLISEGDVLVYADSAYSGAPIEAELLAKKVRGEINEKGTRGHPLTETQKESNRLKSKIRARVEHVFGQMTGSMKALYQRCIGFERNKSGLILANLVYNLLRFEQIKRLNLNSVA
jgi:IS5 family transposase